MSWAGYDRALPPEMLPNKLFDRLFGARDTNWIIARKASSMQSRKMPNRSARRSAGTIS